MRTALLALAVAALTLLPGCFPPPDGNAPLRYRDDLPGKSASVTSNVVYSTAQDGTANPLHLDVYRPTPDNLTRRPAVVLVHGGSFRTGSKLNASMVALAQAYAKKGYVAASIDYRLLQEPGQNCSGGDLTSCVRAALAAKHDAQAAIRFLRANAATYGIDPTRIAIQGGSAGGGTSILVAVNGDDPGSSGTPGQDSTVGAAIPISGGLAPGARALIEPSLDRADPPVYFLYGTNDPSQPAAWPIDTAALINQKGGGAFTLAIEGGHVPSTPEARLIEASQSSYFMYFMLDLAHAQGQPPSAAAADARQLDRLEQVEPALAARIEAAREAR